MMSREDMSRAFPSLKENVRVTIIDALPNILPMFDRKLVQFAEKRLMSEGVQVYECVLYCW